ncbi:hypothetical protein PHLGIDRAFT_87223, partial [Phlebiopsis gigantea 11061_1 CR5-6]
MGLDRMSRRVRDQRTSSLTPSPSSRPSSLASDKCMSDAPQSGAKSLTPHRKHHKLLKDGSEVWSEDVERVFVQGLKEYWESPWATYSRGRSRWRNQFLVEHLKKAGIERSKKQVASHIQVLRNMWRGEPEFHLVAGGEELFTENGLLASPQSKDGSLPRDGLPPLEAREALSSSSSSTPDYIPPEFMTHASSSSSYGHDRSPLNALDGYEGYPSASNTIAVAQGTPPPSPPSNRIKSPVKLEPLHMGSGLYALPASGYLTGAEASPMYPLLPAPNRLLSLCLWAEGMSMFVADVDRIQSALAVPASPLHDGPSTVLLRIKISLPAAADVYGPPSLQGFRGVVSFASPWSTRARCNTAVYAGRACVSQEAEYLDGLQTAHVHQAVGLAPQSVSFNLPESSLSRCRWFQNAQDLIVQHVLADGVLLAVFMFQVERTAAGAGPSAELVGFQRRRATVGASG